MRHVWIGCVLAAGLAGFHSPAMSQDMTLVTGQREQLRQYLATVPYAGSDAEICTMAVAALNRAQQAEPEPVLRTVGSVDCGQDFVAAGFGIWPESRGLTFRRVIRPGQFDGANIIVGVDYGCYPRICLGTAFYMMKHEEGIWTAGDQIFVMP